MPWHFILIFEQFLSIFCDMLGRTVLLTEGAAVWLMREDTTMFRGVVRVKITPTRMTRLMISQQKAELFLWFL